MNRVRVGRIALVELLRVQARLGGLGVGLGSARPSAPSWPWPLLLHVGHLRIHVRAGGAGLLHGRLHHLPHLGRHVRHGFPGRRHRLLHFGGLLVDVDPAAVVSGMFGRTLRPDAWRRTPRGTRRSRSTRGRTRPPWSPPRRGPAARACGRSTAPRRKHRACPATACRTRSAGRLRRSDETASGHRQPRPSSRSSRRRRPDRASGTCGNDETWSTPFPGIRRGVGRGKKGLQIADCGLRMMDCRLTNAD